MRIGGSPVGVPAKGLVRRGLLLDAKVERKVGRVSRLEQGVDAAGEARGEEHRRGRRGREPSRKEELILFWKRICCLEGHGK